MSDHGSNPPPPPGQNPYAGQNPYGSQNPYGGPPSYGGQPPSGGGPYGQPYPGNGGSQPPTSGGKGFFGALFDFRFEHFITPMIVKIVYVLALVALVITWLVLTIAGFTDGPGEGIAILVLGAIAVILYLAFIRMTLEFYLAIVRMSQDIHQRLR